MSKVSNISKTGLLVISCLVLTGMQDFPQFRMEELEFEARQFDEDLFKDPELDEISGVSSRYEGDAELARFPVDQILIEGVVPYPNAGISQDILQDFIDDQLISQKADELDDNGFTGRDLSDMGAFLREVYDRGSQPDQDDLARLIEMIQRNDAQRGWITVEQLDAIALSVTEYYRERGFILATAFVPAQEVQDGVIRLNVLEGRLGSVEVNNNEIFDSAFIAGAFSDEIGEPVTEERVESALRRINDLPGVRVRGSFSQGDNVGETRLNLNVIEEKSWTSGLIVDNHGAEQTGENRIFATTEWVNMWGIGHRLALGLLRSEGPDATTYGLIEYELPVTRDGKAAVRGSASSNQFAVARTAALPAIIGETENYGVTGSYQFLRGRTLNLRSEASYTYKDVLFQVEDIATLSTDQQLESFAVFTDYTQLWDDQLLLLTGRVGIDQGRIINGALRDQSTNFTKVLVSANLLKRFDVYNWLIKDQSFFNFVVRMNSQYSEKFLSSVEQFSLGGPNGVRAFNVSDVSVDSGIYAGVELYFDLPFDPVRYVDDWPLEPVKPYIFFDYGYGTARALTGANDRDAIIKGYGLGMRFSWPGRLVANLIFATPSGADYEDDFLTVQGESRIYIDVNWTIR